MRTNVVYCGDCIQGLKKLPDKSVDLILTDPPYGIGFNYDITKELENTPEKYAQFIVPFFQEAKRVTKKFVAIAQTTKYMKYFWEWFGEDIRIFIGCKNFVMLRNTFMNYAYDPWVFYLHKDIDVRINNKPERNLDWVKCDTAGLRNPKNIERNHPCPKPLKMMREIIRNFTNENDVVLDPFMGSGTTALACKQLNRRWVGFEISPEYCKIIKKRLSQKVMTGFFDTQAPQNAESLNSDLTSLPADKPQILPLAELR